MKMLIATMALSCLTGCYALFPQVPSSPGLAEQEQASAPATPPPAEHAGSDSSNDPPPTPAEPGEHKTQEELAVLSQYVGTYHFSECEDGVSLGGDPMCWDYEVALAFTEAGKLEGRIELSGYQMETYSIRTSTAIDNQKNGLLMQFIEYGPDVEEPENDYKPGQILVGIGRRKGKMCMGFGLLKPATKVKHLCET